MGGFDDGIRLGNLISILPYSGQYWVPSARICQPHFACNLCMTRNINRLHTQQSRLIGVQPLSEWSEGALGHMHRSTSAYPLQGADGDAKRLKADPLCLGAVQI